MVSVAEGQRLPGWIWSDAACGIWERRLGELSGAVSDATGAWRVEDPSLWVLAYGRRADVSEALAEADEALRRLWE